jgi:tetrahydromethanopterin S-methyltransferase subunit G
VPVPEPTVTEAEVAELEQQLDEIDQLLTEIELDLSQD